MLAQKNKAAAAQRKEGPRLLVLFGSQTGTAQEFAEVVTGEGNELGFSAECVDLDNFEPESLADEKTVVFLMATYGDGEPTDNAKSFMEWLADSSRSANELENTHYAVFGLGNRSYDHFCAMGVETDSKMHSLGATRLLDAGLGDEESHLEEEYEQWKTNLWLRLCEHFGLPSPSKSLKQRKRTTGVRMLDPSVQTSIRILEHWSAKQRSSLTASTSTTYLPPADAKNPRLCEVIMNRELHTSLSDRSCRHIEIELDSGLRYAAGDHLGVYPENDTALVDHLLRRLEISPDEAEKIAIVYKLSDNRTVMGPAPIRRLFTSFTDITNPPRRSVLAGLAECATDAEEKAVLHQLGDASSAEGTELYQEIKRDTVTIGEVLDRFPSVRISFDHLLELLPRLSPRFYSISSSPKACGNVVHITAVVTTFQTPTRTHHGVCSTWLQQVAGPRTAIPVFVRTSEFRLPSNGNTDIIMIGPGTGYAPFRGFIQERKATAAAGKNILFFGCRNGEIDHIYKEEMEAERESGVLTNLFVAYSRETEKKVYVQHLIEASGKLLWDSIETGGHIYVCGDGQTMAHDVRHALEQLAVVHGNHTKESAESFFTELHLRKRYQTDVW